MKYEFESYVNVSGLLLYEIEIKLEIAELKKELKVVHVQIILIHACGTVDVIAISNHYSHLHTNRL